MAHQFEGLAIWIHLTNVTTGGENAAGMSVGIPQAGDDLILVPGTRSAGEFQRLWKLRVVAAGDVERLAIGREHDAVGPVFTTAFDAAKQFLLVVLVVTVGIAQTPKSLTSPLLIHHHIQAVEGVQQAVRSTDRVGQLLDLG